MTIPLKSGHDRLSSSAHLVKGSLPAESARSNRITRFAAILYFDSYGVPNNRHYAQIPYTCWSGCLILDPVADASIPGGTRCGAVRGQARCNHTADDLGGL
jgi:hypothetical protein